MTPDELQALTQTVGTAEGLRLKAYQDSEGVWTIGYGTNLQELEIDRALADRWLVEKLRAAEYELRIRFVWFTDLSSAQRLALTEMMYNLGATRFLKFKKMIAALARKDYATARAEALDSVWRRQVKDERAFRVADALLK